MEKNIPKVICNENKSKRGEVGEILLKASQSEQKAVEGFNPMRRPQLSAIEGTFCLTHTGTTLVKHHS